jgi:hypothetical protein
VADLKDEARALVARLRTPRVTHHQISEEWEPYKTVQKVHPLDPVRVEAADMIERLLGTAGVKVDAPRKATDTEIAEWAERHDLRGSATDLRCAFEDAQTLHMADGVDSVDGGQKNGN